MNSVQPVVAPSNPPVETGTAKNKFQYLFFDLSRAFLKAVVAPTCDCASIAAKILLLTLPILSFFEGLLDLCAMPFIWTANKLCKESIPTPNLSSPPPIRLPPAATPPPPTPLTAAVVEAPQQVADPIVVVATPPPPDPVTTVVVQPKRDLSKLFFTNIPKVIKVGTQRAWNYVTQTTGAALLKKMGNYAASWFPKTT